MKKYSESPVPCDILLVEAGGHVGYQVMRSLARHGLRVCICDTSDSGMSFVSRYAADSFVCPDPVRDSPGYVRRIAAEAASRGVRAVLPIFHPEVLSRARKMLPDGVILLAETPDKIAVLDDKVKASALAASLGIRQPRIYEDLSEIGSWPVVFKRAEGLAGSGVYFPKNRKALDNLMRTAKSSLVMEYIDGYDCSVDALRWGGKFVAGAYRVKEPQGKGFSIVRESLDAQELLRVSKLLLESIDYNGLCGIDFRISYDSGVAYFLECNPRFSGGVGAQLVSGFDLPWLLWSVAIDGVSLDGIQDMSSRCQTTESLSSAIVYMKRHYRKDAGLGECLRLLCPLGKHFDDVDLTDFRSLVRVLGL